MDSGENIKNKAEKEFNSLIYNIVLKELYTIITVQIYRIIVSLYCILFKKMIDSRFFNILPTIISLTNRK